ncbi:MAG: sn-glycerol-3-phosphate ABC transporter ATP-binding protein UgpC [Actinobacteria bacterium]|jgi:multiple sugar transport system ATP-binding protein|nr:sn-glycerol-3-phosphate ABC transporter ATP-binding protein UgpC [Actinomycetota bacterium]MBT5655699.1 sn-glycerol-3-phosphate ABC transporter ATP-binding protein UgpC [Actinomycetota bacterium]MBT7014443.1 sn-glycerol-3-phosphate ABC transporter ATP-binding protein UgpC [Actinomycetota bacterium]MDA9590181.1 sn-glycerol-3-phosphate ABC transporter ATP-binding protein UgpC [Candidatus Actinomarina sp.]MDA9608365.1 sn-glycerol-3-phosphate ABC transporter ATP-binding protein UgpC [Candidatus 
MGAIKISSVGKIYPNGTRALEDVNIEINDGEFVVLVGPSGCGKTTLLRMVAGLEDITEGEIFIGDKIVNEVAPKDRDIAMVFQNYALYPHMSVYDNMAFSLKLRKLPKEEIDKKVKDAARTLEISELLERKPKALSGGQRQRVAMGRAIVRSPEAFLMDEPLSNLDAKLRVQMRAELGQLHTQLETTTLYVTHDQVEAMTMGDRVAVIRKGELQQIDTPREIYLYPKNIFVAGFIGSPSMNFVYADVKVSGDKTMLTFAGEEITCVGESLDKLKKVDGKQIVLGIRPEAFEDSTYAKDSEYTESISITVTLLEQLGSDSYIHFYKDLKPVQTEAIEEILADEGEDISVLGDQTKFIARINPNSTVKEGEEIKLSIDPSKLHFFDPESGKAL